MYFNELSDCILMLKTRIPENANVIIDFRNVRGFINNNLPQEVVDFDYDKITNEFKIIFKEADDEKKKILFTTKFNLNKVRR